jgi:hypothetical protein
VSFAVAADVLRARLGLGTQAKMILLGLAEHARNDGSEAWPSVRTLAAYAECHERTVQRHLRTLEAAGLVRMQREARGSQPRCWKISLSALTALTPSRGDNVTPLEVGAGETYEPGALASGDAGAPGRQDVTPSPVGVASRTPRGGNSSPRGDIAVSPEPVLSSKVPEPTTTGAASPRDRDEVWDDLEELFGSTTNDSSKGSREKAAHYLRQSNLAEGELAYLVAFANTDRREWVRALVETDVSIAKHLDKLRRMAERKAASDEDLMAAVRDRVAKAEAS